ncbi:MAG TPA: vitamin B12-dependent ribonucleotide reductase, partial [Candidatus Norongarragalinales archaeon]|nr:vitamin B12-dependent ribonucleotide reductase [Candidatus Norongarragalinales archaeon]
SGRINASNPCSEFVFLDDTSCNLASLNLMKFRLEDGSFDTESFKHAVKIMITAMEIIVGNSSYPTEAITRNSNDFRPLGLGYANLGALLMSEGLAYDSDEGRNFSAAITSLMSGYAYYTSTLIAKKLGPFKGYSVNEKPFLNVISMHREATHAISEKGTRRELLDEAEKAWDYALESGRKNGFRNAQISVLAPTGTISFMMDCDTTGVEPDIALIKYKWLVGGGMMKIVNTTVPLALEKLGYKNNEIADIMHHLNERETIEGAPHLKKEHLSVFDCAFKPTHGKRSIHYIGHIKMMAATQPFISGAISKTVNMPSEATSQDIESAYMEAWRMGLKAIAIYRDGSKRTQPLTTAIAKDKREEREEKIVYKPMRERLPDERKAITHKFGVGGHEGYITVGLYEDGRPGEIFVTMAKEGSTISGMMDAFSTAISIAFQYGVPLKVMTKKFTNMRFEPSGVTNNEEIRFAKSIMDYIFKWLALKFLDKDDLEELGLTATHLSTTQTTLEGVPPAEETPAGKVKPQYSESGVPTEKILKDESKVRFVSAASDAAKTFENQSDAPACDDCGSIMVRSGACYKCFNCGSTSGCS